jgi:hypothetical protein
VNDGGRSADGSSISDLEAGGTSDPAELEVVGGYFGTGCS